MMAVSTGTEMEQLDFAYKTVGFCEAGESRVDLTGVDREQYLQNVCTNDVKKLAGGSGIGALLLHPKGKVIAPIYVIKQKDSLILLIGKTERASMIEHLEQYIIMEDVQVVDNTDAFAILHVCGPKTEQVVDATECEGMLKIAHKRIIAGGIDLLVPAANRYEVISQLEKLTSEHSGGKLGATVTDILRIEGFIPKFGVDYSAGNLVQEAAQEILYVDFDKGCYTGQETVARTKTYGGVKRRLVGLLVDATPPMPGTPIFLDGEKVGHVTSAARSPKLEKSAVIALVDKVGYAEGTELHVGDAKGPSANVIDIAKR